MQEIVQSPNVDLSTETSIYLNSITSVEYFHIPTVEKAREFFGPVSDEERAWRGKKYFNSLLISPRSRLGIGEHDRSEAYIFGNGIYPEGDKEAHKRHFPVSVKAVEIDELFVGPNDLVDLSAYAREFPWDTGNAEIYLHLTIRKLILSANSKLLVKGNVLIMECLKTIGNSLGEHQAIIALSSADPVPSRLFPGSPSMGNHGAMGVDGAPLIRESTPLGLKVHDGSVINEGQKGDDGHSGSDGSAGRNGTMLFLSDIRFGHLEGFPEKSIKISAGAANGASGQNGGKGGDGGKGGNGASGTVTPFGVKKGWRGGDGGNGGNGGNGGKGGNGGLTCDVFVSVPAHTAAIFQVETFVSQGGRGGDGGKGGNGGTPGSDGELYETGKSRTLSLPGAIGKSGIPGVNGKARAAASVHIYERLIN